MSVYGLLSLLYTLALLKHCDVIADERGIIIKPNHQIQPQLFVATVFFGKTDLVIRYDGKAL